MSFGNGDLSHAKDMKVPSAAAVALTHAPHWRGGGSGGSDVPDALDPMTLAALPRRSTMEDGCRAHRIALQWPVGCGGRRLRFTALVGTPVGRAHLPLRSWFGAVCLPAFASKGVSTARSRS